MAVIEWVASSREVGAFILSNPSEKLACSGYCVLLFP